MIFAHSLYENGGYFGRNIWSGSLKDPSSYKLNDRMWEVLTWSADVLGKRRFPTWNTDGRPSSPLEGEYGLNTTTNQIEIYNGSAWRKISTV